MKKIIVRVIAGLAIAFALLGLVGNFLVSVEAETAVHQIYYSVETIKYALVPYCLAQLCKLLID